MKRAFCLVLAILMLLLLAGCTSGTGKQIRDDAKELLSWWSEQMDSNRIILASDVYCIQSEDKSELVLYFTYVPRATYERINCEIYQVNGARRFEFDGTGGFQNTQEESGIDGFGEKLQGDLFQIIDREEASKVIGCGIMLDEDAAKLQRHDAFEEKATVFFTKLCSGSAVIDFDVSKENKTVTLTTTAAGISKADVEAEARRGNDFSDIAATMIDTEKTIRAAFQAEYDGVFSLKLETASEDGFVFLRVQDGLVTYRYGG